ncbi:hypothetical protein [Dactylosporangium salmoneum]|uniref:Uncharacterized protein n=1 Tax=Dactylosporangium salmoneum TaxID=53361 RepID=A0ABP5TBX0_9ACTN
MSGERTYRKATAEDITALVRRAGKPFSGGAILSGMGLGDAQRGIAAAFNEAVDAGLIVVHHVEPGPLHMPHEFYVPAEVAQ